MRRLVLVYFLVLTSAGALAATNKSGFLKLEQAIQSAIKSQPLSEIQSLKVEELRERQNQDRAPFMPSLSAAAQTTRQELDNPNTDVSYSRLQLRQNIFKGGQDVAEFRAAGFLVEAERANLISFKQDLAIRVMTSYLNVLSSQKDLEIRQSTLKILEERIGDLRSRIRIGRSRHSELLSAQSQLMNFKAQLLTVQAQLDQQKIDFQKLTGLPAENLQPIVGLPPAPKSNKEYMDRVEDHPSIKSYVAQTQVAEQRRVRAARQSWPSVDIQGNYYFSRSGGVQSDNKWDVGAGVSLPLFEGGRIQAEKRETALSLRQAELNLQEARNQLLARLQQKQNDWKQNLEQASVLESSLKAARSNYEEQAKDYRFGLVSNLDVLQALSSLQDAQRAYDGASSQAWASYYSLRIEMNEFPK